MKAELSITTGSHVIDILGNVIGRDQPIMLISKAVELVSCLEEDLLTNDEVVFFDPFCKAGEILLACALARCLAKVNKNKKMIDVKTIQEELYGSNRYFALAPDERHHRLSLRTFLGNTNSHDEKLTRIIRDGHYLSEIDGRLDKKKFEKEFNDMLEYITTTSSKKKIVVVGNPPYQEADGGYGKSAKPIYNYFAESLMNCKDISEFLLVIPSRWFSGGKGLNDFRNAVLQSKKTKCIKLFKDPREVFPTVDINGGICFLHLDNSHNSKSRFIDGNKENFVNLSLLDAIPDDIKAYELIEKIRIKANRFMVDYVYPRNPFGITSTTLRSIPDSFKNKITCLIQARKRIQIPREMVLKNHALEGKYKVAVPAAVGGTKAVRDFLPVNQFFIVEPGIVFSETYIVIGAFETQKDAEKLLSFLKTDFCRYFIGLRKLTQHLSRDCWSWVPQVDFSKSWNDDKLFEYFNLTQEEQKHIKKKIKEWS
jgi:hypothetical protein